MDEKKKKKVRGSHNGTVKDTPAWLPSDLRVLLASNSTSATRHNTVDDPACARLIPMQHAPPQHLPGTIRNSCQTCNVYPVPAIEILMPQCVSQHCLSPLQPPSCAVYSAQCSGWRPWILPTTMEQVLEHCKFFLGKSRFNGIFAQYKYYSFATFERYANLGPGSVTVRNVGFVQN